jgi:hypothetical protein
VFLLFFLHLLSRKEYEKIRKGVGVGIAEGRTAGD